VRVKDSLIAIDGLAAYSVRMASVEGMVRKLREKQGWVPGKRIKLDFGADGIVLLDGVAGTIDGAEGPADTTIIIAWDDLLALGRGEIDPVSALMQGRLRIDGDMANAMQLQGVIEKLQSD
jgi:putative sterol carrier protein